MEQFTETILVWNEPQKIIDSPGRVMFLEFVSEPFECLDIHDNTCKIEIVRTATYCVLTDEERKVYREVQLKRLEELKGKWERKSTFPLAAIDTYIL